MRSKQNTLGYLVRPIPAALKLVIMSIVVAGSSISAASEAEIIKVPVVQDLQSDSEQARNKGLVLLLIVSSTDCGFCERLKREIIRPIIASGAYQDKVLIRELLLDRGMNITDFDGTQTTAVAIAGRYDEGLTPTVLFLSPQGLELTARRRGINSVEFYHHYLDKAIDKALLALAHTE